MRLLFLALLLTVSTLSFGQLRVPPEVFIRGGAESAILQTHNGVSTYRSIADVLGSGGITQMFGHETITGGVRLKLGNLGGETDFLAGSGMTITRVDNKYTFSVSGNSSVAWSAITGKPSTFAPTAHTHTESQITDLNHFSGVYRDLTGKPTLFDGSWGALSGKPSTFTPSAHTHPASEVTGLDYYTDADIDGNESAFNNWDKNGADDFDGTYSSLTGKPTIPTNNNQLVNGAGYFNTLNDGTGNGLDADLLDGQEGSYYLDYNNLNNKPTNYDNMGLGFVIQKIGVGNVTVNNAPISVNPYTPIIRLGDNLSFSTFDGGRSIQINAAGGSGGSTSTEDIQDAVGLMLSGNTESGIAATYDDSSNEIDFVVNASAANIEANAVGASELSSSGILAGTYGSSTQIPRITFDTDGRATDVTLETISTPSGGDGNGIYSANGFVDGRVIGIGTSGLFLQGESATNSEIRGFQLSEAFFNNQSTIGTPNSTTTGWDGIGYRGSVTYVMNNNTTIVRGEEALYLAPPNQSTAAAGSVMTKQADGSSSWESAAGGLNYSTTEKVVGEWFGEPLYEITIVKTNIPNNYTIIESLNTEDNVISSEVAAFAASKFTFSGTYIRPMNPENHVYTWVTNSAGAGISTKFNIRNEYGFDLANVYITVRYTK